MIGKFRFFVSQLKDVIKKKFNYIGPPGLHNYILIVYGLEEFYIPAELVKKYFVFSIYRTKKLMLPDFLPRPNDTANISYGVQT